MNFSTRNLSHHQEVLRDPDGSYYCGDCNGTEHRHTVTRWSSTWERFNKVIFLGERDGFECFYCQHFLLDPRKYKGGLSAWWPTLDHLLPQAYGGQDGFENLVLACGDCNVAKGNKVLPLVSTIKSLRTRLVDSEVALHRARNFITALQWDMFDHGLGDIPGEIESYKVVRAPKNTTYTLPGGRPKPYIRDPALSTELGDRACGCLRAENYAGQHGRRGAIGKRFRAAQKRLTRD